VTSCTDLASKATPLGIEGWLVAQANVVLPLHLHLHFLIHSYDVIHILCVSRWYLLVSHIQPREDLITAEGIQWCIGKMGQ
jgi:hypothetical protein